MSLPTDYAARKAIPLALVLDYFPDALAEVARVIAVGQAQHSTHGWDRAKSGDEASTLLRHFLERGGIDTDGVRHSAKMAWRALALLQKEIEAATGCGISRGSYDSRELAAPEQPPEACIGPDLAAQRESWARGEMAMGNDADEARERAALTDPAPAPASEPTELYMPKEGERVRVVWVDPTDHSPSHNVGDVVLIAGNASRNDEHSIYISRHDCHGRASGSAPGEYGTYCRVEPVTE